MTWSLPIRLAAELIGQQPKRCSGGARFYADHKLKVDYAGTWHDFSQSEGGDLPGLVKRHLGCEWPDAFKWLEDRGWENPKDPAARERARVARAREKTETERRRAATILMLIQADRDAGRPVDADLETRTWQTLNRLMGES